MYDLKRDIAVFDNHVLNHLNYSDAYEGEADTLEYEVFELLPANASDDEFWALAKKYGARKALGPETDEDAVARYLNRKFVWPMKGTSELPAGQYEVAVDEDTGRMALVFFADEEDMYQLREHLHGYDEDEDDDRYASVRKKHKVSGWDIKNLRKPLLSLIDNVTYELGIALKEARREYERQHEGMEDFEYELYEVVKSLSEADHSVREAAKRLENIQKYS